MDEVRATMWRLLSPTLRDDPPTEDGTGIDWLQKYADELRRRSRRASLELVHPILDAKFGSFPEIERDFIDCFGIKTTFSELSRAVEFLGRREACGHEEKDWILIGAKSIWIKNRESPD